MQWRTEETNVKLILGLIRFWNSHKFSKNKPGMPLNTWNSTKVPFPSSAGHAPIKMRWRASRRPRFSKPKNNEKEFDRKNLSKCFCSAESIRRSDTRCKKENQKQIPKIPLLQSLWKRNHRDGLQSQNLSRNSQGWPCLWWQVGSEAMLSKCFHFFKSYIWLASRIRFLQAKERSWKYGGVWGEKEADLGRGKGRLVFFLIFLLCLKSFLWN